MNDQPRRRPAKPHRRPKKDPVRFLAFEALRAVDERDAYANLVLPPLLKKARARGDFDGRDAALATELVYGTLRRQGTYDAIVAALHRPAAARGRPAGPGRPEHGRPPAARHPHPHPRGRLRQCRAGPGGAGEGRAKFVNAVLRKVTAHDLDGWVEKVAPPYDEDAEDHLAVVHSHPRWIVSALWDALGGGRAGIEDLLEADNERPEVTLVARPGRSTTEELVKALGEDNSLPGRWSPYAVRMAEGGEPGALEAVRESRAGVQDEGSQLVAAALAAVPVEGRDSRWLDGCAGPGGKAALLAALAAERGATLLAAEKQPHRARLVERALAGNPGPYQVITADGTRPPWLPGTFDRILMDVPCSGLGALRRRPESRWRRRAEDLEAFAPAPARPAARGVEGRTGRRRGRLRHLLAASRGDPGGRRDVLKGRGGEPVEAEWIDARPLLPGVPALGEGPDVQLWPHLHGTDAMYLALLRRTG